MKLSIITCCLTLLASLHCQAGDIYKRVLPNGQIIYSDKALGDGYVKMEKTWKGWSEPETNSNIYYNRKKYSPHIDNLAKRYQLSSSLIHAVIHTESHFNPVAESHAGAVGLMQLMPATATRYGVFNRKNPIENIEGGTRYLSDLMKLFDNNIELVLAAYNAGENAVKRYGNSIPPYPETQRYVKKVLSIHSRYAKGEI